MKLSLPFKLIVKPIILSNKVSKNFARKIFNPKQIDALPTKDPKSTENLLKDDIFSDEFKTTSPENLPNPSHESESSLTNESDKEFKKLDKEKLKFIRETLLYQGDDAFPEKVVERPEKGVVWGLGGELMKFKKNFFTKGEMPTVEEIIAFLELEQGKDITLVDLHELKRTDLPKYGILVTTYSARHNYKIAKNLVKALIQCEIPDQGSPPKVHGLKTDEWVLVCFKEVMVHLFVEEARDEIDLEWKWKHPVTDEEVLEMEKLAKKKKGKGAFEPFNN